ncbi:MAG: integrase family protein [Acidobacteriia bacterium]|nr:integrase family protein [Terriglobia bacterium]MYG02797.1 integrase family protein [Terriglobia bacterium]
MGKLSAARVKSITKRGLYGDGGTLYLAAAKRGSESWVQRVTIDGKRRDIGFGGFPQVGLAAAGQKAMGNCTAIAAEHNLIAHRRRSSVPTFAVAARRTHATLKPRWRNGEHADSWMQTLECHASPALGGLSVDRIERADVLAVLTPIWGTRPETARRVRQRGRAVLQWVWAHGFIAENVAGEAIDGALPAMPAVKAHLRALPYRDVAAALDTIGASLASLSAKACLRFVVLTACRSGEARLAK